jgi:hypothetical protein
MKQCITTNPVNLPERRTAKILVVDKDPYSVTIKSHNGQLTLHIDSHASDSGAVRREGRTVLGAKSKLGCHCLDIWERH